MENAFGMWNKNLLELILKYERNVEIGSYMKVMKLLLKVKGKFCNFELIGIKIIFMERIHMDYLCYWN